MRGANALTGGVTLRNNLFGELTGYFVDAQSGDLHLTRLASGAINQGIRLADVKDDFDGFPRDATPDIGACEFGAAGKRALRRMGVIQNILRQLAGKSPQSFQYHNQGMMVVIGRNAGGVHLMNRWTLTGFPAWLLWLNVHIFNLIGFRNRLFVMVNWARDYVFSERAVRLILPRTSLITPASPILHRMGGSADPER